MTHTSFPHLLIPPSPHSLFSTFPLLLILPSLQVTDNPLAAWPLEWSTLDDVPPGRASGAYDTLLGHLRGLGAERDRYYQVRAYSCRGIIGGQLYVGCEGPINGSGKGSFIHDFHQY